MLLISTHLARLSKDSGLACLIVSLVVWNASGETLACSTIRFPTLERPISEDESHAEERSWAGSVGLVER